MTENHAQIIARFRLQHLQPAVEQAASHPDMPIDAVLVGQCEAAITSCAAMAGGDMKALATQYRAFRDEALTLFLQTMRSSRD